MSRLQALVLLCIVAAVTALTRFLPFLLFPKGKETPPLLQYLGRVLPGAIVGMLVVYCLRSTDFASPSHGIPEMAAAVFIAAIHKWRHNLLLSIVGGTALYMLLIRLM